MRFADDDVKDVWVEYKKTGSGELRNRLIEKYWPFVRFIAKRLSFKLPSFVDRDDLANMGIFGLVGAIKDFDLSRNVKFTSYCYLRVRGSILDELRHLDWVPRETRLKASKFDQALHRLRSRLIRDPSFSELANELGLDWDGLHRFFDEVSLPEVISFSGEYDYGGENKGTCKLDFLEDNRFPDPTEKIEVEEWTSLILGELHPDERLVVALRYWRGLKLKKIGNILELSESRVGQLLYKALARLSQIIEEGGVNDF